MMISDQMILAGMTLGELFTLFPYLRTYFDGIKLDTPNEDRSFIDTINAETELRFSEFGMSKRRFASGFLELFRALEKADERYNDAPPVEELVIIGGTDKSGLPEDFELHLFPGDTVCIVGPTGAGKSRLLSDIECLAQNDTVTRRRVELRGPADSSFYRYGNTGLIAQLSQSMSFVVDAPAGDFIAMHALACKRDEPEQLAMSVIERANELCGEPIMAGTPLPQLSGGQTRALMTADTALISHAPIVLIDEIENAGVDKAKALEMLCDGGKLSIISTHDPVTALQCAKRIVISDGGVRKIIEQSETDKKNAALLARLERTSNSVRDLLRAGICPPELTEADFFTEEDK